MAEAKNTILPELIDTSTKLSHEAQKVLIRLGQDIIFIDKVKNDSE